MSAQLISHSPDLLALCDSGFDIAISDGHLIVSNIPYFNHAREIKYGKLVCPLSHDGENTNPPENHVMMFQGEYPCDKNGQPIEQIRHHSNEQELFNDFRVQHSFSSKPPEGYRDYQQKVEAYAAIISGHVEDKNPAITGRPNRIVEFDEETSIFKYSDDSSARSGIASASRKLELENVAIVGLGGTGSYLLDFVAKTRVCQIHLFDGDVLK